MEPKDWLVKASLSYLLLTVLDMVLHKKFQEQFSSHASSNRQNHLAENHEEGPWEDFVGSGLNLLVIGLSIVSEFLIIFYHVCLQQNEV